MSNLESVYSVSCTWKSHVKWKRYDTVTNVYKQYTFGWTHFFYVYLIIYQILYHWFTAGIRESVREHLYFFEPVGKVPWKSENSNFWSDITKLQFIAFIEIAHHSIHILLGALTDVTVTTVIALNVCFINCQSLMQCTWKLVNKTALLHQSSMRPQRVFSKHH